MAVRRTLTCLTGLLLAGCVTAADSETPIEFTAHPISPGRWEWQLQAPISIPEQTGVADLDPDEVSADEVAALVARGVHPIAYISVGTWEDWRGDADAFPEAVLGRAYDGWEGERFLDIRDQATLLPIMRARFARAKAMGFTAIEPDNIDLHINDTGFGLTASDVTAYVTALAEMAHEMGLRIGQKNAPELVPALVSHMDFIVTEDCFADGWCDATRPYFAVGKLVLAAEYTDTGVDWTAACAWALEAGAFMILAPRDLDGPARAHCF